VFPPSAGADCDKILMVGRRYSASTRRAMPTLAVMALAAIAATLAQLIDLATFARMVTTAGPTAEANPLVSTMLMDHGLPFVAVAKIAALSLIVGVIAVLARQDGRPGHPRLALAIATLAVAAGLLGGLSNVAVIG
jgi:hypothetical protein